MYELSFKWHCFIFQESRLNISLFKIYSLNLYVLTCSLILWHWHSLSLSHLYTILLSLLSLRDLKITAKNVTDFEVGRTEISGQRELTEGRRAPWELTAYTPSTGCLFCAVCNALHCTLYRHSTLRNTDATRGHLLIWFRGLLWDYIELFVKINKTQLVLK